MSARRWTVAAIAALVVVVAAACQPWPQFMGNPALTGDDTGEATITTANVATLAQAYEVPVNADGQVFSPTVMGGKVYAAGYNATGSHLVAGDGITSCSGAPKVCAPLWSADLGHYDELSAPLVSGGVVYETAMYQDDHATGMLAAYDAAGSTNCSGSPKVCTPLWTAPLSAVWGPNVSGGQVYVDDVDTGQLDVFDAAGTTNCSGSPKVCTPVWTASVASAAVPSVSGGKVYLTTLYQQVEAFDASGSTDCSGSPVVCTPLFTVPLPARTTGSVAVSGGIGYVIASGIPNDGTTGLFAFDASGVHGCSGSPVVCQPLRRGDGSGYTVTSTPAVAGGRVYVSNLANYPNSTDTVDVYDAAGTAGCSGTPVVCEPLFSAHNSTTLTYAWKSPTVTAHVVFVGGEAYDAAGSAGCSGSPTLCTPLWSVPSGSFSSAAVSAGTVFVGGADGYIHAYELPSS